MSREAGQPEPTGLGLQSRDRIFLASLNARSIRHKSASIFDIIKDHNVDIFTIVESWHEQENELSVRASRPDGYRSLDAPQSSSSSHSAGQSGGGIVIVYRDTITGRRIQPDFKPGTFEFLLAMLKMPRTSVIIFAIYRTGPISTEFFNELTSLLEMLVAYSCPIIMTGDVNIHLDVHDDRDAQQFNDILDSFGLFQSVRDSTHLNGRTLDVVISRSDLPPPIVQVGLPGEFSDHSLLVFQLPIPRPPPSFANVSTRSWKNFDEEQFRDELLASPLCSPSILSTELFVDKLQDIYDSTLAALVDRHAPRLGLPTTPNLIPGGDSLFIDGRKLAAAGETFFGVLDACTRVLENLG